MHKQILNPTSPSGQDYQRWEYKTFVLDAKKMNDPKYVQPLNELGDQGWELVSTSPGNTVVSQMVYIFKRPKRR